jgi:hypothetical protein
MLVRERPATAIRYEPGMLLPGLVAHPSFGSTDPFLPGRVEAYATLETPKGFLRLHPGDWIVTRPDGTRRVLTPEAFEREYEQAA